MQIALHRQAEVLSLTPDVKAALLGYTSPWNNPDSYRDSFWQPTPSLWRRYAATIGGWLIVVVIVVMLCGIWWLVLTVKAHAHMGDRPDSNDWLMTQHNAMGAVCCNGDDVFRLSDSEWGIGNGHY